MNISVIGTDFVGIVVGTCFAETGNNVKLVDIGHEKYKGLRDRRSPLHEPGLVDLIIKNFKEGRLVFTNDIHQAVKDSFVVFMTTGLPVDGDGSLDTTPIFRVSRSIGKSLDDYKIIITSSTSALGTTDLVRDIMKAFTDVEFDVVSNPVFLKDGSAIEDFMNQDTLVIGTDNPSAEKLIKDLYAPFVRSSDGFISVPIRVAELTKHSDIKYLKRGVVNESNRKSASELGG
jgi:UDPglucose 6-dehydrogenase